MAPSKFAVPNRRAVASLALVTALSALEKQRKARSDRVAESDLQDSFAAQDMSGELQTIPARHGVATYVPRGRTIKIINTYGKQVVSAWAFGLGAPPEDEPEEDEVADIEGDVERLKQDLGEGEEKEKMEELERKINEEVEKPKVEAGKGEEKKDEVKEGGKEAKDGAEGKVEAAKGEEQDASKSAEGAKNENAVNDDDDPPEQAPETPENEKSTPEKGDGTKKSNQKRTWASYLPAMPYRNRNPNQPKADATSNQESKTEKEKNAATSKKWSSYLPTGKGFSSYVPNVQLPDSQNVISAFQATHGRDPNKSYAEQLYDFSKTPVGAGGIAAATGSGTASSLYAAYSAYTKMNASKNDQPPMEYLSLPHTRASTKSLVPRVDDTLLTNLRNPIMTLIEDTTPGAHDTLTAACDASLYAALGVDKPAEHGSCAENLVLALKELNGKAGLKGAKAIGADITVNIAPTPLHLFMNAPISVSNDDDENTASGTGAKGARFAVEEPKGKKRSFVRFRAERDVVVVLSACPMDVGAQNGGKCMAANFMVEVADEDDLAASQASVKKAPRKLGGKKAESPPAADQNKSAENKDGAQEEKVAAGGGGMPRLRGGPGKPAAVQKSAQDAKNGDDDDGDDDPPESQLPSSAPEDKKEEEKAEQSKPEPAQQKQEEAPKSKKKPKKLERRGAGTSTPSTVKSESS